jgi:ribosomal protein S12 methylthiotransferase accessory factor
MREGKSMAIRFFDTDLSAPKRHTFGTHRTRSPEATLEAYLPKAPAMGITRLANITGLDSIGLPVYTSIRPNSRSLATSQGKGVDGPSAKASALMEAIETWHAEHIDAPLRYDSYLSLRRRANVVDIEQLIRLRNRSIHLDAPRAWIEGWDLLQNAPIWVPFEFVSLYFVTEGGVNANPFLQSSTGISSGNHLLEAMTHGLCEVIERDAEVLWIEKPEAIRIDLSTVDDPSCRHVLSLLKKAGVHVAAWDITSDIGVPAYSCAIMDEPDPAGWRVHGAYSGFGCHLSPGIALLRALTEAVQSRVTFISGSRDDMFRRDYMSLQLDEAQRVRWAEMQRKDDIHPFGRTPSVSTDSFERDVQTLLDCVRSVGVTNAIVIDLTKPEFGIPVVKVIVPGLEESGQDNRMGDRARRAKGEGRQ